MIGAIIGDIVGSTREFNNVNNYDFELFPENSEFTDDTILTIATAKALLDGNDNFEKYYYEFGNKYKHPLGGYGGRFSEWLNLDKNNLKTYNSYGNGCLSRLSPIFTGNIDFNKQLKLAKKSVYCTHNSVLGGFYSTKLIEIAQYIKKSKYDFHKELEKSVLNPDNYFYKDYLNKFDETCKILPICLKLYYESTSFEDCLRRSVIIGGDSDTIAAITCSLAELDNNMIIPKWIIKKTMSFLPKEFIDIIKDYYKTFNYYYTDKKILFEENNENFSEKEAKDHIEIIDDLIKKNYIYDIVKDL